jgi:hypothetical protein
MPKVVLTFKDCEKWKHFVVTQGAEVRSIITFRSARLNACEARTEYLTYWFMMPRMPTFDASYSPQVVEDDSPSYKVTCLLVGNTLKNRRYWVVPGGYHTAPRYVPSSGCSFLLASQVFNTRVLNLSRDPV